MHKNLFCESRLLSVALKRSILIGLSLSTPTMEPLPDTLKRTMFSALGHDVPSSSSTSTVIKLRSCPSALIPLLSAVKRICDSCPAVFTSFDKTFFPFFLEITLIGSCHFSGLY